MRGRLARPNITLHMIWITQMGFCVWIAFGDFIRRAAPCRWPKLVHMAGANSCNCSLEEWAVTAVCPCTATMTGSLVGTGPQKQITHRRSDGKKHYLNSSLCRLCARWFHKKQYRDINGNACRRYLQIRFHSYNRYYEIWKKKSTVEEVRCLITFVHI